jgi:hypothetical protein
VATIPDREEHRRRFAALDLTDRRTIVRAVNRGQPVDRRKLAPLAVGVARRQKRFWKYAWLVAPAVALAQVAFVPPEVVLMSGLISTLTLGVMSLFFYRRAARAEQSNLQLAAGPSAAGRRHPGQASAFGRHLPTRSGATPASEDGEESDEGDVAPDRSPIPPDRKPYKPRRRKRR